MNKSAMRGVPIILQNAATALNAPGTVIALSPGFRQHTLIIKGNAGSPISAGAVQAETADDPAYAGTWAQVGGGPIAVIDNTEIMVTFEGVYNFFRVRISTAVVGGNVTVTYEGK